VRLLSFTELVMKYYYLILFLSLAQSVSAQDFLDKTINTKISEVTVFLEGAQITRTAKTNLSLGHYTLILDKLSPFINQNSIQVKGVGDFTVLSVNFNINHLENLKRDYKTDSLRKLSKKLEKEISEKNGRLVILKQKEQVLFVNNDIKTDD